MGQLYTTQAKKHSVVHQQFFCRVQNHWNSIYPQINATDCCIVNPLNQNEIILLTGKKGAGTECAVTRYNIKTKSVLINTISPTLHIFQCIWMNDYDYRDTSVVATTQAYNTTVFNFSQIIQYPFCDTLVIVFGNVSIFWSPLRVVEFCSLMDIQTMTILYVERLDGLDEIMFRFPDVSFDRIVTHKNIKFSANNARLFMYLINQIDVKNNFNNHEFLRDQHTLKNDHRLIQFVKEIALKRVYNRSSSGNGIVINSISCNGTHIELMLFGNSNPQYNNWTHTQSNFLQSFEIIDVWFKRLSESSHSHDESFKARHLAVYYTHSSIQQIRDKMGLYTKSIGINPKNKEFTDFMKNKRLYNFSCHFVDKRYLFYN